MNAHQGKMIRIYIGEADQWAARPLYEAIVMKLREMGIAGATVYKGFHGYGAQQRMHKRSFLSMSTDLPIVITVIDKDEKIRAVLPVLEVMVDEGLIALSDVEMIKH